jgi:2-dehydro-3-deoxyglucarate aldolase/4-hydroxy-2-oxoheptanedioate aldolase
MPISSPPDFRQRLLAGERLIGTLVSLGAPEVTELLAGLGFDWLFIDTEHAPFDALGAQSLLQAAGSNCPCVIRVPVGDEVWLKKALDIGAAGVIVPQVNSAEQAEHVVRLCKYPPEGTRGVGIARAHGYGERFQDYVAKANQEVAVIVQAEHIDAVKDINAIVKVKGIDAVFIGPYDLSASMGKPGQVGDPEVRAAIERVRKACMKRSIKLGIFGVSAEAVLPYLDQGFSLAAAGVDVLFLSRGAKSLLAQFQAAS